MKIRICFKTPDAQFDAVNDLHSEYADDDEGIKAIDAANKVLNKFISYGEYITIDFDTNTGTATVLTV